MCVLREVPGAGRLPPRVRPGAGPSAYSTVVASSIAGMYSI